MSLSTFKEISDGRSAEDSLAKKSSTASLTRVWRAVTSSAYDGPEVVMNAMPLLGARHPTLDRLFCKRRNAVQTDGKMVWRATATYSTDPAGELGKPAVETFPQLDPPTYEWDTEIYQRPFMHDKDGKAILNSAGDFFENGVDDQDSFWVCTVHKNIQLAPPNLQSYRNAVNNDAFALDGMAVDLRCAWMRSIKIGPWQNRNGMWFRPVTFNIAIKDGHTIKDQADFGDRDGAIYDDWQKYLLDLGLRKKCDDPNNPNYGKLVPGPNADGTIATRPFLLDGRGNKLQEPVDPEHAYFIPFRLKRELSFTELPLW